MSGAAAGKRIGKTAKIWLQAGAILAATGILVALCRIIPWLADNVYIYVSRAVAWLFSWLWAPVPTSVAEILLYLAAVIIPVCAVVFTVKLIRGRDIKRGEYAGDRLARTARVAACFALLFYLVWGCNYSVSGVAERYGYDVKPRAETELAALVGRLGQEAAALSETESVSDSELSLEVAEAVSDYTGWVTAPAKSVITSRLLSEMRITGVFSPFTAEANVNTDAEMPRTAVAASMAHELMHGWGIAHEGDATFLGFVSLYERGNDRVKYSALFEAIIYTASRLQSVDRELGDKVISELPERVKRDLMEYNAYWSRFEGPAADAADAVNDAYLKFQGEEQGTESYGEFVDLLLAYFEGK